MRTDRCSDAQCGPERPWQHRSGDGKKFMASSKSQGAAPQAGRPIIYVDSADGDLKVKFSDGFFATIASDS
jgi:hypothetical protein